MKGKWIFRSFVFIVLVSVCCLWALPQVATFLRSGIVSGQTAPALPPLSIDIRTYGAVAGADSTAAIQNATTAANTAKVPLYVPAGIWKVSTCLLTSPKYGMYGDGVSSIIQAVPASAPACVIVFTNSGAEFTQEESIHDLTFDGNATAAVTAICYICGAGSFTNVIFERSASGDGLLFNINFTTPTGTNDNTLLIHVTAQGNASNGVGMDTVQSDNNGIGFVGGYFANNGACGILNKGTLNRILGGNFTGNQTFGVCNGSDSDTAATTQTMVLYPDLEDNVLGGGYSALHAGYSEIHLNQSAAANGAWTGNPASRDVIYYQNNGIVSFLGTGNLLAAIAANSGTNIIYRCTVAGTLPVGTMTTVSANCGTAVDTGFRAN